MAEDRGSCPLNTMEKVARIKASHCDLSHMGGARAVVQSLREVGQHWPNAELDAKWILLRCEHCRRNTTRGMAQGQVSHLPNSGVAGEVMGFDLRKVTSPGLPPWVMLSAVDFCSRKVFAWDFDIGEADLAHVQSTLLRLFADHELPLVSWSDNGGQFKKVIQAAIQQATGCKPRHIPPNRPEANGLVEVFNRIMDAAHGGDRSKLMSAVIAYNALPPQKHGASPETLWRAPRPSTSRWRNAGLQQVVFGQKQEVTEQEWLQFLDDASRLEMGPESLRQATDILQEQVGPICEAIESQQCRSDMANRLRYNQRRTANSDVMLLTGDRVLCKSTHYVPKTRRGKVEGSAD